MVVSGGTISAKVEGSTDSARGMLHIFKDHLRKDDTVNLAEICGMSRKWRCDRCVCRQRQYIGLDTDYWLLGHWPTGIGC